MVENVFAKLGLVVNDKAPSMFIQVRYMRIMLTLKLRPRRRRLWGMALIGSKSWKSFALNCG